MRTQRFGFFLFVLLFTVTLTLGTGAHSRERRPINASKAEILDLIRAHAGVVDRVAGKLGVTRRALYYHFRKLKIDPNRLRKNPHR